MSRNFKNITAEQRARHAMKHIIVNSDHKADCDCHYCSIAEFTIAETIRYALDCEREKILKLYKQHFADYNNYPPYVMLKQLMDRRNEADVSTKSNKNR